MLIFDQWLSLSATWKARFEGAFNLETPTRKSVVTLSISSGERGISARSMRRFCSCQGIHYRSRLRDQGLDNIVRDRVASVEQLRAKVPSWIAVGRRRSRTSTQGGKFT